MLAPRNLPEKPRTDLGSDEKDLVKEPKPSLVPVVLPDFSLGRNQARWGAERLLFRDFSDGGSRVEPDFGVAG